MGRKTRVVLALAAAVLAVGGAAAWLGGALDRGLGVGGESVDGAAPDAAAPPARLPPEGDPTALRGRGPALGGHVGGRPRDAAPRGPRQGTPAGTGALSVRLVDEHGRPVTRATVRLAGAGEATVLQAADASGVYRFEGLPPGPQRVNVWSPLCRPTSQSVEVGGGPPTDVTIRVEVGLEVGGVVVDPAGRPVPGAHVAVLAPGAEGEDDATVVSEVTADAEGRFAAGVLPAGRLWLLARAPGFCTLEEPGLAVEAGREDVRLRGVWAGKARLRLVAGDGQPLPEEAEVAHGPPGGGEDTTWSDTVPIRDGVVEVGGFWGGEAQMVVDVKGYAPAVLTVTVEAGEQRDLGRVVLDAGHALEGTVVDASGRPVPDAAVSAAGGRSSAKTDAQGRFRLLRLPAGPVDVSASADGFVFPGEAVEAVVGAAASRPVRLALARWAAIDGQVQDADGRAAAGTRLEVWRVEDDGGAVKPRRSRAFRTDDDGTFHVRLAPGRYRVVAAEDGAETLLTLVTLGDGEARGLSLALPRR